MKKEDLVGKGFSTRAIHAGQTPDKVTGAIMTPITLSSTFVQEAPGKYELYDYSRAGNPTRQAYEDCVASLENGIAGFGFSSGCAATMTVLHLLKAGDHVIAGDDMYGGTFRLFDKVLRHHALSFSYVDMTSIENLEAAVTSSTKMVWLETPTNPLLKVFDIERICKWAKSKGILVAVDNTFMSPYFQKPLDLGADIVVHSATKFINGHSDVIGGVVAVNSKAIADELSFLNKSIGAIASPFDSYLAMRSLKTLAVRMQAHQNNAFAVAELLQSHPKVEKVVYPGLKSHPQYEISSRQCSGFGGMVTFYVKGNLQNALNVFKAVKVFSLAESLGGVESLIEHPGIMTHASVPAENRAKLGISDTLIRLSVGIEDQKDLVEDLKEALDRA